MDHHALPEMPHSVSLLIRAYIKTLSILSGFGMPLFALFTRFWMAKIFWYSGLTKIANWSGTLYLFEHVYKVPYISPVVAAYAATSIELICPVLLILGLATRLCTIPMLVMALVIGQTTSGISPEYWIMLLAFLFLYGAGKVALDHWIDCIHWHITRCEPWRAEGGGE
jgi:putative oxidoreductase